jgi:DNA repair protein RecN (Recombination protein N)
MLTELLIRDVGVIEDVILALEPGLNVLTGETGTGKTMVVSALELLLGARADADQVRGGADVAVVEGRLHPPPSGADEWLGPGDDELVVSREVTTGGSGRSRARLGGRLAPASALADVVGQVIEVHGQADTSALSTPAVQRELLDRAGDEALAGALADYRQEYARWQAAEQELTALRTSERDRARELDRLSFELSEIDAVDPQPGEDDVLDAELRRLEHAEALTEAAAAAAASLNAEGGARDTGGEAATVLRGVASYDEALAELSARAEALAAEAQDLGLELAAYAEDVGLDPARLEELRARRAALGGLLRKYGPDVEAVRAYAHEARRRISDLQDGEERSARLETEVEHAREQTTAAGERVSALRRETARRVAAIVEGHLAELAMAAARMEIAVEPTEPGAHGADRVTFLLAANPGEALLPLAKAASGGERSRVALAVRLALAHADRTPVVVFDEVDAGIGGATALAVGRKLARLAADRQVLCVTHLAQLAAFADAHFRVSKATADGRTTAAVELLDESERVTELSRMLSGAPDSELAAGHAAELRALALAEPDA